MCALPAAGVLQEAFVNFQNNNDDVLVVATNTNIDSSFPSEMEQIREFYLTNGVTFPFATINQLGHCNTEFCDYNFVVIGEDYEIVAFHYQEHITAEALEALYETGQMSGTVNIVGLIDDMVIDDDTQTIDLVDYFDPEPGTNFTYGGFSTNQSVVTVSVDGSILSVNPENESGYFNVIASCDVPGEGTSYAVGIGYGNNSPEWTIFNSLVTGFDILGGHNDMDLDSDGILYFGNYNRGIEIYDGTSWDVINTANSDLPTNGIMHLNITQNDAIWVVDFNANASKIVNGEVTETYNSGNSALTIDYPFGIVSLDNGDVYYLGIDYGDWVYNCFKFDGLQWHQLTNPPNGHSIYSDGENIWLTDGSLDNNGLFEYDMDNDSWIIHNSSNTSFPADDIGDIVRADNGDLWVCGGYNTSIDYMWLGRQQVEGGEWEIFQNPNTNQVENNSPYTYDIMVHSNGDVLISTFAFGTFIFDPSDETWEVIDMSNSPMESNYVMNILEQEDHSIWLGCRTENLAIYSGNGYSGINDHEIPSPNYTLMNYPNPFNPETTISYSIPFDEKVTISVYNIKGQKVKTLMNEMQEAGKHSIVWNGKDSNNKPVSSGVYFFQMHTKHRTDVRKMMLIK